MSIFDSLQRNIKNVFVGSHRGDDFILSNLEKVEKNKTIPKPDNENDLGVDPNEWFEPRDNKYAPPEKLAELETMNPRPEEEVVDWFNEEPEKKKEEKKTPHHIAYEIATGKNNPFAVGGSESIHDFDSVGGSEEAHK